MMHSFCSKDCLDTCRFEILDRDGDSPPKFRAIGREWDSPPFVCRKLADFYEREVLTPASSFIRLGDEQRELDSDAAIDRAAKLLSAKRNKPILYLRGSGNLGYAMQYWDLLMAEFPNCHFVVGSPCMNTGEAAHEIDFKVCENPPIHHLEQPKTILVFGRNAKAVSPHLHVLLRRLQKAGSRVIHIDPVRTESTDKATAHIPIRPGCDGMLAAALLTKLGLEDCGESEELRCAAGVGEQDFALLAESLQKEPCGFITGTGPQRYGNGCNSIRWINRLAVRTNNQDFLYYGRSSKGCFVSPEIQRPHEAAIAELPRLLQKGYFDLILIIAANPLLSYPESNTWQQAMENTPLLVVDAAKSTSADMADIFLKVGGMFSQPDVQGSYFFPGAETERSHVLDCRAPNDTELIRKLGRCLDIPLTIPSPATVERSPMKKRSAYTETPLALLRPALPPRGCYRLLTSSCERYINSQWLPRDRDWQNYIHICPELAKRHGIRDGEDARISSKIGEFSGPCKISTRMPDDLIMVYKSRLLRSGSANMVIPSLNTDAGGGLAYYDAFVRIERTGENQAA